MRPWESVAAPGAAGIGAGGDRSGIGRTVTASWIA
jgi:hypothetical protein